MKTLYIVRHAKSSWNFDLPDHDRPLGKRGRKDVIKMAKHLSKNYPAPDIMITSTASRAFYTALFIADKWGYPEEDIILSKNLFHADTDDIVKIISKSIGDSIAIFGHNPGFTKLFNHLTDGFLDNLPTCGVAGVGFDIDSWTDIKREKGRELFLAFPKKI